MKQHKTSKIMMNQQHQQPPQHHKQAVSNNAMKINPGKMSNITINAQVQAPPPISMQPKKEPIDSEMDQDRLMIQELHDEILCQIKEEEDERNKREDSIAASESEEDLPELEIDDPQPKRPRRAAAYNPKPICTPPPLVLSESGSSTPTTLTPEPQTSARATRRSLRKRKHRDSEEFPSDDAYKPDNNSCNVINKNEMDPPPTEAELDRGYCHRTLKNGKIRLVCTTCGKHYTTCLLYTSPSPRDRQKSRMPSSA